MVEYTLAVSDAEIQRYLFMADRARGAETELWQRAGIVPGAVVADIGCGPALRPKPGSTRAHWTPR